MTKLLSKRVIDMLLGCTVALVGTAAAFPRLAAAERDSLVDETPDPARRNAAIARRRRATKDRIDGRVNRLQRGIARRYVR